MTLDLIIRGAGSSRNPGEHLATLSGEYSSATTIMYGEHGPTGAAVYTAVAAEPEALAEAIKAAGDSQVLVYGDEVLLSLAQHMQPGLIWITLGSDANGVREIWRIRQQHSWLSSKKLALLIEQLPDSPAPDTERLMRLSRATRAVLVASDGAVAGSTPPVFVEAQAETTDVEAEVAVAAMAVDEVAEAVAAVEADQMGAEAIADLQPEPQPEPEEVPPAVEAVAEAPAEAPAETESSPEPTPEPAIIETKGADAAVETTALNYVAEKTPSNAQEALIQRYALVKERRANAARIAQVEEAMQNLLKEIFVSRFAAGPEAAAAFEALSRKLTDASAEFTQLSRTAATLEEQLAKLAWVKEELEI